MPWIEHGSVKAHFRGEDSPDARETVVGIIEALACGPSCEIATREEHHSLFERAYERGREKMQEGGRDDDTARP